MNPACKRAQSAPTGGATLVSLFWMALVGTLPAIAQIQSSAGTSASVNATAPNDNSGSSGTSGSKASISLDSNSSQSPFLSSVPEGKATTGVVQLSFKEAIDRAL